MTPRELVGERYDDALGMVRIVPAATREAFIAALTRNVNAQATPPRLSLSPASQFDTSYKGSVHAQQAMSARPSALSMAAADLDGDAVTDLAIGFAAPGGGLIAIHHGNIDAFAPQSEKSFWAMTRGEFPSRKK